MHQAAALWRANTIAFVSSFCVMVIELIAARMLAPYIGVSLYTWTSIIGVILAGIALGNYLGGKLADRRPSPSVLAGIFLAGGLATVAILPAIKPVALAPWFDALPVMWGFTLRTLGIFFLPSIILSMVSPMVIKLTLADLGQTGGIVGTIYACSTAGSILGTFVTGFYLILWFGTRNIVWFVAGVLILMGIVVWFSWKVPNRWQLSLRNFIIWTITLEVILAYGFLFYRYSQSWEVNNTFDEFRQSSYTRESNYYTIRVMDLTGNIKGLVLDTLIQSYVIPGSPANLHYDYLQVFEEIFRYTSRDNQAPRVLHLGGGGYSFPHYLEVIYPESINDVVEIDPVVTEVAYEKLGLPSNTKIKTYSEDARFFLFRRNAAEPRYDIAIGDVFSDRSTPYHLTTLEFDRLVKANLTPDGIYLINLVDDYERGRYLASSVYTLKQAFKYVYLFGMENNWDSVGISPFVIAAMDHPLDLADYEKFVSDGGRRKVVGNVLDEARLEAYLAERVPILLTDDHVPTDILVANVTRKRP
ncbi:MAG: fused MFS/spermidine synthase [Chloroflexota bacterium]